MYRDFYHLEYVPFTATPDSDLMNLSRRHQAVLERVVKSLSKQQSLIVFMGEAGLGKVGLLRSALATYYDPKCKTVVIDIRKIHFQNQIYFKDIIKSVYEEIGYEIKYQTSSDALTDLHDIFVEEREKDSNFIIVINYAHLLPHEVLKSIPKLIDAFPYEQPLAQLVLAGDPVLDKHLRDPNLQALKKRVQLVAKLDTFNQKESMEYIRRKLAAASPMGTPKVFSNAAARKIVKAANGIPRNLNMICTDALVAGCKRHKKPIPANTVKQVITDFQGAHTQQTPRWVGWGVALLLLTALGVGAGIHFQTAISGYWQTASQWSQQTLEQVWKTEASPPQAPMPVEAPVAIPANRPASDGLPPLPQTAPKPLPPQTVVEAPRPVPASVPAPAPAPDMTEKAMIAALLPPRQGAIEQVANLIDQHFPKGKTLGLKVWSNKALGEAYTEGENLVLYVTSKTPAFLRIDYYQADGKIVHLLPNPLINNQVKAGERFTLGGKGHVFQFKVAPPFGTEMLTVVASQQPVESQAELAASKLNDQYIGQLSRQLQAYGTQGKVAASYVRIQTQPQGSAAKLQPVLSHGKP